MATHGLGCGSLAEPFNPTVILPVMPADRGIHRLGNLRLRFLERTTLTVPPQTSDPNVRSSPLFGLESDVEVFRNSSPCPKAGVSLR